MPEQKFIEEKIQSFKKYINLEIPEKNVILFDKTKESLEEFVENQIKGNIKINRDTEECIKRMEEEIQDMAQKYDKVYKTNFYK